MSMLIAEADATVDAPAGLVLEIIRDFDGPPPAHPAAGVLGLPRARGRRRAPGP